MSSKAKDFKKKQGVLPLDDDRRVCCSAGGWLFMRVRVNTDGFYKYKSVTNHQQSGSQRLYVDQTILNKEKYLTYHPM